MVPFAIGIFLGCAIMAFLISLTDEKTFAKKYEKNNYGGMKNDSVSNHRNPKPR